MKHLNWLWAVQLKLIWDDPPWVLYFKNTEIRSKASANLEVTQRFRQGTHFGYTQLDITSVLQGMHHCLPYLVLIFDIQYVALTAGFNSKGSAVKFRCECDIKMNVILVLECSVKLAVNEWTNRFYGIFRLMLWSHFYDDFVV